MFDRLSRLGYHAIGSALSKPATALVTISHTRPPASSGSNTGEHPFDLLELLVLSYLFAGLALGSVYAIAAGSLVITYVASGVFNLAFAAMALTVARVSTH